MQPIRVAMSGGGPRAAALAKLFQENRLSGLPLRLVGVADEDPDAPAMAFARSLGIFTDTNALSLLSINGIEIILELTGRKEIFDALDRRRPRHVHLVPLRVCGIFEDVLRLEEENLQAERKAQRQIRALRQLKEEAAREKKKAEGIISGSPIPMFVLNRNHRISHWNRACEQLTGYPRSEMIGTDNQWKPFYRRKRPTLADLLIENKQKEIEKLYRGMHLRRSSKVEGAYEAEHFFPHLGEHGAHLYLNAAPIKDEAGKVQGAIVTYQDFTERNRMLEEIKRREQFEKNLIENSIDGIIATEAAGKIVIFNRGAVEILGYSPEETIGKMSYVDLLSEEVGHAVREAFYGESYGPPGKIVNMEARFLNRSAESIPVRLSGTLLYEQDKEVGSVVFIQDLREIHKLQKEKQQAERMAAIGRTVAGLAHYIKNILTGVQGGAYVINSAVKKEDLGLVQKGWNMVERNIDQIAHIVQDMLIYSQERTPSLEAVDPNELLSEVLELMEEKARISGVRIVRKMEPGIGPVLIDRTAIHRCLLNLVSNAVDACTLEGIVNGSGEVTAKTERPQEWAVKFEIIDNGTGMDRETQGKLFTDFFTTKGYKGTGLGLPVTRKIVREHGGRLVFASRPGKGTTFALLLPESPALKNSDRPQGSA